MRLLRQLFGLKTEKRKSKKPAKPAEEKPKSEKTGHSGGRQGRDDYLGAKKVCIDHPDHQAGDSCPECHHGKLAESEPGVRYDWQGVAPITLTIYLLQRLVCNSCKTYFTAPSPVEESADKVDATDSPEPPGRVDANASANTMVALLRFWFGVAHYRLAKLQVALGIGLPESTQYRMLVQVYLAAQPIYEEMIDQAMSGARISGDDTWIKILDWMAGKGPPSKNGETNLKSAKTSTFISESDGRPAIVLYVTDQNSLGSTFSKLLERRTTASGTIIYTCDALAANKVGYEGDTIILTHCLDHARRKFIELENDFPEECQKVIGLMGLAYKNDQDARDRKMSRAKRRDYHNKESLPAMIEIKRFLENELESGRIEENSPLGSAAKYYLKHVSELTEFCHTPGAPISNIEAERMIKKAIVHRKNSLFFKTLQGAKRGDVILSILATCEKSGTNPIEYLTFLQVNASRVRANPELFLPWMDWKNVK